MRTVIFIALVSLLCIETQGREFKGSELLVGRGIKQPPSAKRFTVGLGAGFAPLDVILSSQKQKIINEGIAKACASAPNKSECETQAKANADQAMKTLGSIPDSKWKEIEDSASDLSKLEQTLVANGVPQSEAKQVVSYVSKIPDDQRKSAVAISRKLASQKASNILLEPWAEVNLKYIAIKTSVPFTLTVFENSSTEFNIGNIYIDTSTGYVFSTTLLDLGVSGGLSFYIPTATKSASAAAFGDLIQGPKFLYGYLSLAPWVSAGIDFKFVSWQAHAEWVSQLGVKGSPIPKSGHYIKYGTGVVLFPSFFVSVIGELIGMYPVSNAELYKAIFAVGGLQVRLWVLKMSLAVQAPIWKPNKENLGTVYGVDMGQLASFSILGRVGFTF